MNVVEIKQMRYKGYEMSVKMRTKDNIANKIHRVRGELEIANSTILI